MEGFPTPLGRPVKKEEKEEESKVEEWEEKKEEVQGSGEEMMTECKHRIFCKDFSAVKISEGINVIQFI